MHNSGDLRKLKDQDGNIVSGLFRGPNGNITVIETPEAKRRRFEAERAVRLEQRINKTEHDISKIMDMLGLILQKLEK